MPHLAPRRIAPRRTTTLPPRALAIAAASALLLALDARSARAEPTPAEIALARRLFAEGRAAEDAHRWDEASRKFRDALTVKETAGLRFHLALCEENLGRLVEALVDYDRAEEAARAPGARAADVLAQVEAARDTLRARTPTLEVRVARHVDGAALSIDGQPVAAALLDRAVPLDPGAHHVAVAAPAHAPFASDVLLHERDALVLDASLAPLVAEAPTLAAVPPRAEATGPAATSPARTWVLAGEAAASLGSLAVGLAFTRAAASDDDAAGAARDTLDARGATGSGACRAPTDPAVSAACDDLGASLDEASRHRSLARAAFVGAGASAVAFAATAWLWPARGAARARVAPAVGAGSASVVLAGTF